MTSEDESHEQSVFVTIKIVAADCDYCGDKDQRKDWKNHELQRFGQTVVCVDCDHAPHWHAFDDEEFGKLAKVEYQQYKSRGEFPVIAGGDSK